MADSARNNILQRLHHFRQHNTEQDRDLTAHSAKVKHTSSYHKAKISESSDSHAPMSAEQKTEAFVSALEASHAEVVRISNEDWLSVLDQHLEISQISNLLFAPGASIISGSGTTEVGTAIARYDFKTVNPISFEKPVESIKDDLFNNIEAGISFASGGIAETGTLLLRTGPDEPRTLSLVPPVHYIWIDANSLYETLADAFSDPALANTLPTNLLLISGPSKTADIQQTLAYGAHGPKRLIVLLVNA